jgi:UDP-N-acetylglucosamine 2-epimerase
MSDSDSVSHAAIVDWLQRARVAARASQWAPQLDYEQVDLVDALVSQLFLNGLGAARGGSDIKRSSKFGLRERAYRVKSALAERLARLRSETAGPTEVLFWPRGSAHVEDMHAVSQAYQQRGGNSRSVACQARPFQGLRARGMNPVFVQAAWPEKIRAARDDGRRLVAQLSQLHGPKLTALEPQAVSDRLAPNWRSTLLEHLPAACVAIANGHAALDRFQPKVLVVGNDITLEGRAAALVAKARGVPTVVMMHGHVGTNNPLHGLHIADRLVAYGDAHRRALMELGIAADAIRVCGAPYLDSRPPAGDTIHPAIGQAFSIPADAPWVLVATSGPGHSVSLAHHLKVIKNLLTLSAAMPEINFVVKLHRKDSLRYYQDLTARHPAKRRLVVAQAGSPGVPDNFLEWLRGCRAVLTGASMVAIEAMLMNVPVITMDFAEELKGVSFIDAGATLHARTPAELEAHLRSVLSSGSPRQPAGTAAFLHDAFFALDGQSARRVADLLHSLAATPR